MWLKNMAMTDDIESFMELISTEIEIKDEPFDEEVIRECSSFIKDQENESGECGFPRVFKSEKEESDEELPLPYSVTVTDEQEDGFECSESALIQGSPSNALSTSENLYVKLKPQEGQNFPSDYPKHQNGHKIKNSNEQPIFICQQCGKRHKDMESHNVHLLTHRNKHSFHCTVCDVAFPTANDCRNHEQSHMKFECSQCGFVSENLHLLRCHTHVNDRIYNCQKCDMKFTFRQALEYHMLSHMSQKEDTSRKKYLCDKCGKRFVHRCKLAVHMVNHFDGKDAHFPCEECGKKLMTASGLQYHIQQVHTIFKCNYCAREYVKRRVLQRHIQEVHMSVKEYKCELCGASFVRADRLRNHVRLHTGEKPYGCNMCHMKYASSSVLLNHKKIIHFGMKLGKKDNNFANEWEQEIPLSVVLSRLQGKNGGKKKSK